MVDDQKSRLAAVAPAVAIHVGLGLVLVLVLFFVVPKFCKMFEEFGTELPLVTQVVVQLSNAVVSFGILLPAPLLVAAGIDTGILLLLVPRHRWWAWLVIVGCLLLFALIALALGLPYLKLSQSLG